MSYLGEEIKKLGFGLMRLPKKDGEIDMEQSASMTDEFMAHGFTYFDTAYVYEDGKSEMAVKRLLTERYPRDKFILASKMPAWKASSRKDMEDIFNTSLERTGAGYFDFYLNHSVQSKWINSADNGTVWSFISEMKEKGFIRHIGFSFHDTPQMLDRILTEHPEQEFVQLQINYFDWESDNVQSRGIYEVARKHNKPIIIMEPVRGGSLAVMDNEAGRLLKNYNPGASLASWALRYDASLDGIITILSGMSTIGQMRDNLSFMENPVPLSPGERDTLKRATQILKSYSTVPCTSCRYCRSGCPMNIHINDILRSDDQMRIWGNFEKFLKEYRGAVGDGGEASDCIECGQCESVCPQHIEIIKELKTIAARMQHG